jgi:hypothetical protein
VVQYQRLGTQFEVGVPFSVNYPAEWAFDYSGEGGRNIEAWQLLDSVGLTSFDQELNPEVVDSWLDSFGSDTLLMVLLIVLWPVEIAIRRWKLPWRRP